MKNRDHAGVQPRASRTTVGAHSTQASSLIAPAMEDSGDLDVPIVPIVDDMVLEA